MNSIHLEELRIARDSAQNRYYEGLRNYGESYYNKDIQNAERDHERLEQLYKRYLDAKRKYNDALDEFISSRPMTEYTSL